MSFRDTLSDFQMLMEDLRNGRFSPIYLLMGEESYFIDKLEETIISSALSVSQRDFNLTVAYGKDSSGGEISMAARRYPMMAERQVVSVREAQLLARINDLESYAATPLMSTVLVLCYKGKNLDRRSALYKKISKSGVVFESLSPKNYELEGFVRNFLQGKGVGCDAKGVSMLCEFVGANLSKIDNEVDKVLSVLPSNDRNLTPELIEKYIGVSKEYNVFELTKALSDRNMQGAVRISDHFAENPKNYPFVVTVSVLFNHFQRLMIVALMRWEAQRSGQKSPSDADFAKRLGVAPYVVKEYTSAVGRYPLKSIFGIIALLREYDMKGKGVDSTQDDGALLRELILLISVA